ncbi:hypothetical protein H0E87_009671 [Populus deltoides]|uniref:Pectinesterase inhibitor domain-containing protein n=1 Tax=Populus deltoides TaxID=3696 RepID=A0A8T2YQ83_POPDE|nr:hypothetical protein H0E87_009671 [Populus deltoides]
MGSKNLTLIFAIVLFLFLNFPSRTQASVGALVNAIATSNFFTGLANTNPASKQALVLCATYFKEAVTFLNLKGLEEGSASLDVHYALDQAGYCETALSTGHVHIASATDRIQKWKSVFSAAYAAVITLEN